MFNDAIVYDRYGPPAAVLTLKRLPLAPLAGGRTGAGQDALCPGESFGSDPRDRRLSPPHPTAGRRRL